MDCRLEVKVLLRQSSSWSMHFKKMSQVTPASRMVPRIRLPARNGTPSEAGMERAVQVARLELRRWILWISLALDTWTKPKFKSIPVYTLCKDHGVGIEASSMVLETGFCCATTATILLKSMMTFFRDCASSLVAIPRCRVLQDLGSSPVWAWKWKLELLQTRTGSKM